MDQSLFKIALIRLEHNFQKYDFSNEHLGIGYLASVLRSRNLNVKIFDSCFSADVFEKVKNYSPNFIGYTANFLNVQKTLDFNKRLNFSKKTFVCFGGPQATFTAEDLIKYGKIDAVVIGEGEETLAELVAAVKNNKNLSSVKGIFYNKNGLPSFTGYRNSITDLDKLPFPSREVLESDKTIKSARIISSRGCLYGCNFCTTPSVRKINPGKPYRERNPTKVVDEMELLYTKYKIKYFYFNDDLYFAKSSVTRKRAVRVAEEITKRNLDINYKVEIRGDSVEPSEDREFILKLIKSGLTTFFIGLESGSNEELNYFGKGLSVTKNKETILFLKSLGAKVNLGKILFEPLTTWNDLELSLKIFHELGSCAQILRRPNIKLELFPGTILANLLCY